MLNPRLIRETASRIMSINFDILLAFLGIAFGETVTPCVELSDSNGTNSQ